MSIYDDLIAFARESAALGEVAGRLSWDQETMMPRGAAEQRGEEMAAMQGVLHARATDARVGEWLDLVRPTDEVSRAQVAKIRRHYDRANRVPVKLAQEIARVTSVAQGVWADARARDDVAAFLPTLAEVLRLKREEGAALAEGGDAYDALIDDYEPRMTAEDIGAMFGGLRPRLVDLRERIMGAEHQPKALTGSYGADIQARLSRDLASAFGYDWSRGRMDIAVHPFSSGSGNDVRITTRIAEADPFNCFYSTIHEVGHACYEQNIDPDYLLTPIGGGASMGVHESQSRIYENQLGRSPAFTGWLFEQMRERFGEFGITSAEDFCGTVNRVAPGFIRTEADEVHYNLHIMMRFDLERALINGSLDVADLEEAWNSRFKADFGLEVDRPSHGVLQDVHWSCGLFGYFPTYSLGNLFAGCLHKAMRQDLPDLDLDLGQGDPSPATAWLRDRVQRHGGLYAPSELIRSACGFEIGPEPLLDYLEEKYSAIYRL